MQHECGARCQTTGLPTEPLCSESADSTMVPRRPEPCERGGEQTWSEFQNTRAAGSGLYLGKANGTVCYQKKKTTMKKVNIWMPRVQ